MTGRHGGHDPEGALAPNEKLDFQNFHGGIIASAFLYEEIAAVRQAVQGGGYVTAGSAL